MRNMKCMRTQTVMIQVALLPALCRAQNIDFFSIRRQTSIYENLSVNLVIVTLDERHLKFW